MKTQCRCTITGNGYGKNKVLKPKEVQRLAKKFKEDQSGLISLLEDIQETHGYLPEEVLRLVATATGRSLRDIYGVATFYRAFRLTPSGKHRVTVCLGTACHVRGTSQVLTNLQNELKIQPGETTHDNQFTLETVNCLGVCALGPIVVIDGEYHGQMTPKKVGSILQPYVKK